MSRSSLAPRVLERQVSRLGWFPCWILLVSLTGCTSIHNSPVATDPTHGSETQAEVGEAGEPIPPPMVPALPGAEAEALATEPAVENPGAEPEDPTEIFAGEELSDSPLDAIGEVDPEIPVVVEEMPPAPVPVTYDIPMVTNEKVAFWIDYYTLRRKDNFLPGMERSGHYLSMFQQIFEEEGLPLDLIYMAHVESAFKTTAYSRAKARGIWQFMPSTGRHYGLKIDYWVDERSDPEKSARAAATYLKKLYRDFGDWYLAMAAYNAGEGKVRRGLRNTGTDDFWSLAKTRAIRRETKNYLPAILAAIQIYKDPDRFGIEYSPKEPLRYESVQVEGAVDLRVLAECAGSTFEELKFLNPALRRQQTPPSGLTDIRVPIGSGEQTLLALRDIPKNERVLYARHQVRRGDTLSTIARAYGVSIVSIQDTNGMGRRTMIRVGQALQIPSSSAARFGNGLATAQVSTNGEPLIHRVRRGESLSSIGKRYGTNAPALADANGIFTSSILQIGQRLTVVPGARFARAETSDVEPSSRRDPAQPDQDGVVRYTVRRGDTLSAIARSFDSSARAIAAANGMSTRKMLRIGEVLAIAPGVKDTVQARRVATSTTVDASDRDVHYTVRRGDSLWSIASSFQTTVDQLCSMNRISKSKTLFPGMRLRVQ